MNNIKDQATSDVMYMAKKCERVKLEVIRLWGQKSSLNYKKKSGTGSQNIFPK